MSTPIVPVPDVVLASEFPSLADRPAGTYNAKAKAWADSENAMSIRNREIALTAKSNAEAAREAADEAVPAAATAVAARDKALEYKESAEATAAAVGVEAGLPSLVGNAGKALVVNPDEQGVNWWDVTPTVGVRSVVEATTLDNSDQALMVRCDGAFTLAFAEISTLKAGWFCYIKNAGDGDITLDPDGAETIDGRTSYIMYPGECRLIAHNGVEFVSVVLNGFYKVFESSGDFVKPPGYRLFEGLLWGAGAGGEKGTSAGSRGGGGGGCAKFVLPAPMLSDSEVVTIGSGGIGAATNGTGTDGGNSIFAGIEAFGGTGVGVGGTVFANITRQRNASPAEWFGMMNASISALGSSDATNSLFAGASSKLTTTPETGKSVYGGGAGGARSTTSNNLGGSSLFGGDGGDANHSSDGGDGVAPGGGGGATGTGARAGNGARGELRIWGVI